MSAYPDTNFLTAFYAGGPNGTAAEVLAHRILARKTKPLPVTFLTRMEVINAIQQQVFFTRNGMPGIHASPESAMVEEAYFFDDLERGNFIVQTELDLSQLEDEYESLTHRYTMNYGFRAYDIIHVASARLLGCDTFWSFDARAKKLAKLTGLKVN